MWEFLKGLFSILHARYIAERGGLRQEYRVSPITGSHSRRCDVPAEEYIHGKKILTKKAREFHMLIERERTVL